tara:strand:+ start:12414 stop:14084 length:1671 start_codon:yes stop_codon:yes gene_type:complete
MSFHIVFIVIIIIIITLLLFNNNNNNKEGFLTSSDMSSSSTPLLQSQLRQLYQIRENIIEINNKNDITDEELQSSLQLQLDNLEMVKTNIKEIIRQVSDITIEDINDFHRKEILKSHIIINQKLKRYTPQDLEIIETILKEIKEDLLTNDNTEERERLIEEENEQNNIIGNKLVSLTKFEVYDKYKELKDTCSKIPPSFCIPYNEDDINICKEYDNNEKSCTDERICNGDECSPRCMYFQDYKKATIFSNLEYYRERIKQLERLNNEFTDIETQKNQIESERLRINNELTNLQSEYNRLSQLLEGSSYEEKQAYINTLEGEKEEYMILNRWSGWDRDRATDQKVNYLNEMKLGNDQCSKEKEGLKQKHRKELQKQISNTNRIKIQLNNIASQLLKLKQKGKKKEKPSSSKAITTPSSNKCGNRKKVSPNCNYRMSRIHKRLRRNECHKRYSTYRGEDLMCQYVRRRAGVYSCDFWKPGRKHTKKPCKSGGTSSSKRSCKGRRRVGNCNRGRPNSYQCRRRYSLYQGEPLQCQYVRKGRGYSCDLWKPGRRYTRRPC